MISIKPSLADMARDAKGAYLMGCGGGGDITQTIPVMNYLKSYGVERFVLGDYALKWLYKPGYEPFGCYVMDLDTYQPSERIHPDVAVISPATTFEVQAELKGQRLQEAVIAEEFGLTTVSVSTVNGAQGVLEAVKEIMRRYDLDLFVTVDIGADAFYSGVETTVQSPLADAISLYVARELGGVYGLNGYGCDAELSMFDLDRNVARVFKAGGYLGGHGLTQQDVADLARVFAYYPEAGVESWTLRAARGELGHQYCKRWWPIYVTPLAAVSMFFDPGTIMEVNPIPSAIAETRSLREAEEIIIESFNVWPETRLSPQIQVTTPPQMQ